MYGRKKKTIVITVIAIDITIAIALFLIACFLAHPLGESKHKSASKTVTSAVSSSKSSASSTGKTSAKPVKQSEVKKSTSKKAEPIQKQEVPKKGKTPSSTTETEIPTAPTDNITAGNVAPPTNKVEKEKPKQNTQEKAVASQNRVGASAFATTQYSHTRATHYEGQTYSIPASPVSISGNTISGTVIRGGIGAEKGTIVLDYKLNFDRQGRYLSGTVTSSGYVTAQINLNVGEMYRGTIANVITTTYGRALSGSLVYPVRVGFDFRLLSKISN